MPFSPRLLALFLFLICLSSPAWTQTQLGQNLNAESSGDRFGNAVALSEDGRTIAVGGFFNDAGGSNAGHVRVFDYDGSDWVPFGDDLDGLAATDFFGTNVALSADGSILAVGSSGNDVVGQDAGAVRVFTRSGNDWEPLGNTILGTAAGNLAGNSVALSAAGDIVAVGQFGFQEGRGQVTVYTLIDTTWELIGNPIQGTLAGQDLGVSVDLSDEGDFLAVGASALNIDAPGTVRVYELAEGVYLPVGEVLQGEGGEAFGESVALSADGSLLVVGVPYAGNNVGEARTYQLGAEGYEAFANITGGIEDDDFYGFRVSLSSAGDRLAVTAPRANTAGLNSGAAVVYELDGNQWATLGDPITGAAFSQLGLAMALSADGNTLALGLEFLNNDETNGGQAQAYDLSQLTSLEVVVGRGHDLRVFPNPTSGEAVTLTVPAELEGGTLEVLDATGRLITTHSAAAGNLPLGNLTSGIYLLRISEGDKMATTRLIVR